MSIEAPYFPIIYVRGYAATMDEIEDTVATPYMGFNLGATKIRQNHKGEVNKFIFESPLIRLMKDEKYEDTYSHGDYVKDKAPAKSVWIFRYYEPVSQSLGSGKRRQIPEFAADLRRFILEVRERVCRDDQQARNNFKVYLVAHSMGGLICRSYLQNVCPNGTGDAGLDQDLELPGDSLVDKAFTYATPHNGIDMLGLNVPDLGLTRALEADTFNRGEMAKYLGLPGKPDRVDTLNDKFPSERFFCLVGTNYNDYSAFLGLSKRGTGPMSDGLVMINNAAVKGAPRAFVHRSHSGHFGIVNSEEGYQNLRRFLFGNVRVDVRLAVDAITLPKKVDDERKNGKKVNAAYYIETDAAVRGARYFLHQRRFDQSSAIMRNYDQMVHDKRPVYLFSGYLHKGARTQDPGDTALAFQLWAGVQVPAYEIENDFWFDQHFPGDYLLNEILTFEVRFHKAESRISYGIASKHGPRNCPKRVSKEEIKQLPNGGKEFEIPLGYRLDMENPPRPGFSGRLIIQTMPWNQ